MVAMMKDPVSQKSAGHMEDAYCLVTGKCGVVVGQSGPGITNMVTSVAAANMGHTPLIIISPSAGTPTIGWDGFQECDQMSVFRSITKAVVRVPHPKRAADCLRRPLITDDEPLERLPDIYRERIDTGLAIKVMLRIGEEF